MPLSFRTPRTNEYSGLEKLIIDAFEPITWFRHADETFGPLNGLDWRARWRLRLAKVFAGEIMLVGEENGRVVAFGSGTFDGAALLGYIDLLAVDPACQGHGYGKAMLRAMLEHFKQMGAVHAHLDCMTTNTVGNALYSSEGFAEVARQIRWFIRIP